MLTVLALSLELFIHAIHFLLAESIYPLFTDNPTLPFMLMYAMQTTRYPLHIENVVVISLLDFAGIDTFPEFTIWTLNAFCLSLFN